MATKSEKPTLAGSRLKSRKRDEKVKFDPTAFRDELVENINNAGNVEEMTEFLETAGNNLDYRRYSDQFFDILIAGGILAPGGSLEDPDADTTEFCVFNCPQDEISQYSQMLDRILRRYKYLQVLLEDHFARILKFIKSFEKENRAKLATFVAQVMANNNCSTKPLASLFLDSLVKDGLSEEFMFQVFRAWLEVASINSLATAFRKGGIDARLDELYPINKRSPEHFLQRLSEEEGLSEIRKWQNSQKSDALKKDLLYELGSGFKEGLKPSELAVLIDDKMKEAEMKGQDVITLIWTAMMDAVEWNKKHDLVAEQALKQVHSHVRLLKKYTADNATAQTLLMVKVQNYCFDNQNLLKIYSKIILLLYHHEVVEEDAIIDWYEGKHSSKGKSVFLEQIKPVVEWLRTAEEA